MNEIAGWVLLGIVVLIFAYLVPAAIRSRQVVVDSRIDDRYSGALRIVATAGHRTKSPTSSERSGYVLPQFSQRLDQETGMNSTADRHLAAADARRLATARAARAAASSRRAAAARRRLILTAAVAVAAVGCWVAFAALQAVPVWAPVVVTALLAGVVVLGRRAAAAGDEADARYEERIAAIHAQSRRQRGSDGDSRLRIDVDPTALVTEPPRVIEPAKAAAPRTVTGPSWTPIPVPPPAYTLKESAPRRVHASYAPTEVLEPVAARTAEAAEAPDARENSEPDVPSTQVESEEDSSSATLDVQAVLARRRAAG